MCYPVRSRAFRDWFFRLVDDEYDTIPTSQAWNCILRHLEAQASRNPDIHVPRRVDQRGPASAPPTS